MKDRIISNNDAMAALILRVIRDHIAVYSGREIAPVHPTEHEIAPDVYRVVYYGASDNPLDFVNTPVRYGAACVRYDANTQRISVWYSDRCVTPGEGELPALDGGWNTIPGNPWP